MSSVAELQIRKSGESDGIRKQKSQHLVVCDSENSTSSMTHDDDLMESDNDVKPFIQKHFPASMGGLSIPHHSLSAAFHGYHAHSAAANINNGNKTPFLLPAEIYKSLFASAVLQKQQQHHHHQHQHHHHQYHQNNLSTTMSSGNNNGTAAIAEKATTTPPPALPPPPFPRNLLFSCGEKYHQSLQDQENDTSEDKINDKAAAFVWNNDGSVTNHSSLSHHNNNNNTTSNNNNHTGNNHSSASATPVPGVSPVTTLSSPAGLGPNAAMPVGGVQGQNPTQGLVHWMSAVMAEHMTGNTHHDPTVGMHYMWNGGVDQCGQHSKDIDYSGWPAPRNHMSMKQGYEAKMSDHHTNLQKGHILDDNRLDHHHGVQGSQMALYGATGALRSGSSSSSSPGGGHGHPGAAAAAALLVVPQPINATKITAGLTNGTGTGRKYQCKMCPQIFSSKADLQLHTQIHMREAKPYKCSQCAKAFANSSYLSQHTRIHLGIKPYRCEICQRKFTQLSHLQQHIRTHTGDKPYKCRHPGCQKAFSQLSNLQSHSRCHQTDKPFKCNSCYKCFSDEPSLLDHIPKHKESKHLKTHICQYCGKSYTQETYLTKHMQKHAERTDKRPPITGASLGSNSNRNLGLSTGIPAVTGEHPYWPKVSPDSAASLTEVMHQQHQQQQQQHQQQQQQQQQQQGQPNHHEFPPINSQHPANNGHPELQAHHRMLDNHRDDVASTPIGPYDAGSLTKTTSSSAFTPINSMTPHLNSLGHHPMAQRPYLYDTISFQNKNVNQNTANSFPNQLISLHQIRNYAHQPAGLMAGEHLLGVSVGAGKDKG